MKKYIIVFASLMMSLTACQKENKSDSNDGEFTISAALDNYTKATDTDFEESDIIGVFVTQSGTPLTTTGNYDGKGDNLEYSKISGKWIKSDEPLMWKDFNATTVYGYYPRNKETVSSITDYPFVVPGQQLEKEQYNKADFLWAKQENIAYGTGATLKFAHRLSNVVITIKKDLGIGDVTDVTIENVANECRVNLSTGVVSSATTGAPLMVLNQIGDKYRAVLAPQTITDKDFIIIKAVVDGTEVVYKYHVDNLILASGKKYTYTITLQKSGINVTVGNITDWVGKDELPDSNEAEGERIPTKAAITSTFIQAYDLIDLSESTIKNYLSKLKEAGITEIIIDQVVYYSNYLGQEKYLSLMPMTNTELEKDATSSSLNVEYNTKLDLLLSYCENNDMKVFLGLFYDNRRWGFTDINQSELTKCITMGNNVMDKILSLYERKYPNALHGWYFSWEVNNVDMNKEGNYAILKSMFDGLLTNINSKPVRRPLLLSPFMNETYPMIAADYGTMWKNLFAECPFRSGDIFAPQDCIGTAKISMVTYDEWMSTYAQAVKSKPGMVFGINVELFNTSLTTEPFTNGRVKQQLEKAANHATKVLSFSYFYHYCRGDNDQNHTAYKNYLNTLP